MSKDNTTIRATAPTAARLDRNIKPVFSIAELASSLELHKTSIGALYHESRLVLGDRTNLSDLCLYFER